MSWQRSSRCAKSDCVEVIRQGVTVWVRDSKDLSIKPQAWDLYEWSGLIDAVTHDRLHPAVVHLDGGGVLFGYQVRESFEFDDAEWDAFVEGVRAGEFDFDQLSSPASRGSSAGRLVGSTADTGPASPVGPGRIAATGAGERSSRPPSAPVAASETVPAGQGPLNAERSDVTTGAGELSAAPALVPVVAGMNVAAYDLPAGQPSASAECGCANTVAGQPGFLNVPAGRGHLVDLIPEGHLDATATPGQPGPDVDDRARDAARAALVAVHEREFGETVVNDSFRDYLYEGADAAVAAAVAVWDAELDMEPYPVPPEVVEGWKEAVAERVDPAWGTGPLVQHGPVGAAS